MKGSKPYCEGCKKKPTIHLTEIIDGKLTEMHLCDECPLLKSAQMDQQFGLADLLAGLADFGMQVKTEEKSTIKCVNCGMNYDDFRKFGRLGCSDCYQAFRPQLTTLLKKIHGSNYHFGKSPIKGVGEVTDKKTDVLQDLKSKLQKAIHDEDFEQAAMLRDKIREAEKKKKS